MKQARKQAAARPRAAAEVVEAPPARGWEALERWAWPITVWTTLAVAFLLAAFPSISDDLFMHLAVGRRFFETGSFPEPDPWLYPVPDYSRHWIDVAYWGMHLGLTKLYEWGGFELIVAVKTLFVVAGAAAPLWLAQRLGARSFLVPAAVLVALFAAASRFIERGSLVSDCLGPWVIAITAAELARPSKLRWLLPPIFLVWTNLHPGVLTGLAFVGLACLLRWREWKRWWPLGAACAVACVVHPDGWQHLLWAVQNAPGAGGGAFKRWNAEMLPTFDPRNPGVLEVRLATALALSTAAVIAWAFVRGRRPWFELCALLALVWLGQSAVRHVTTASLALPVVLASALAHVHAARTPVSTETWKAGIAASALTALAGIGLAGKIAIAGFAPSASSPRQFGFGLDRSIHPFGAAAFLKSIPYRGGLFNEHSWGAFLAWLWDGNPRIYYHGYMLDERFYETDYIAISQSEASFERIVREFDVGAFLLRRPGSKRALVHTLLIDKPEWKLVYWDDRAMVFLKDRPEHAEILERFEYRSYDPFRLQLMTEAMKQDPDRTLQECVRQLRENPTNVQAREIVQRVFQLDPDALLAQPAGG